MVTQWRMCGHNIKVRADTLVQFYENGNFKSFTLFEDAKFQCYGVEVMVMGGTLVEFYDHGGLKQIITTAQGLGFFRSPGWPYQGYVYDPNTFISFLSNGRVKSVKPMQN